MSSIHAIVDRQIQRWNLERKMRREGTAGAGFPRPVITISRTLGSGGGEAARRIAELMNLQLFGRQIIEQIAERSEVRQELVEILDERARSRLESWVDGMLRRRIFDEGDYHHNLIQVLVPLAELGSVVIVGRGANYVLHGRPSLDLRFVAPLEMRIERIAEARKTGRSEAEAEIQKSDAERGRFIKRLFDRDWDDPLGYHIVFNTGRIPVEDTPTLAQAAWNQIALRSREQASVL